MCAYVFMSDCVSGDVTVYVRMVVANGMVCVCVSAPVGLAGPRLSVSEKVDASEAALGTPATLTCRAQAYPVPQYR